VAAAGGGGGAPVQFIPEMTVNPLLFTLGDSVDAIAA
jgi:hypothetical protein